MRCDYCGWVNADGSTKCVKCNQPLAEPDEATMKQESSDPAVPASKLNATVAFYSSDSAPAQKSEETQEERSCANCGYPLAEDAKVCPMCKQAVVERSVDTPQAQQPANMKATICDVRAVVQDLPQQPVNMKATIRDVHAVIPESPAEPVAPVVLAHLKQTVREIPAEMLAPTPEKELVNDTVVDTPEMKDQLCLVPLDNFDGKAVCIAVDEDTLLNRANIDAENPSVDEHEQARVEFLNGAWYIRNLSQHQTTYICTNRPMLIDEGDIVVIGNRRYIFKHVAD